MLFSVSSGLHELISHNLSIIPSIPDSMCCSRLSTGGRVNTGFRVVKLLIRYSVSVRVLVQEKRSYEQQIIDVLRLKGGCVVGFNTLIDMRPGGKAFHSTTLANALKKLENNKKITKTTVREGNHEQSKYCIIETKIEKTWVKIFNKHLKTTERTLKNPELTSDERVFLTRNYIQKALHLVDTYRLFLMCPDVFDLDGTRFPRIKGITEKLFKEIQYKINLLKGDEKSRLVNGLLPSEPKFYSLQEYRKITHEETPDEKRQKEIELETALEKSFQEAPYCIFCGHKSKNRKESEKHEEEHAANLEKNTIDSFRNFKGFHCTACGKIAGTNFIQMEKHRCKIKIKKK